jgi:hypothetical protein
MAKRELKKEKAMILPKWLIHRFGEFIVRKTSQAAALPVEKGPLSDLPPLKVFNLAIVLDDHVQEVVGVNDRLAALLLSDPTIVLIDLEKYEARPTIGWKYDSVDKKFIEPEPAEEGKSE